VTSSRAVQKAGHGLQNSARFPDDFMFRLTQEEAQVLVSQNVMPSIERGSGF
jgi:hypothetical protein